jgi:DNA-binding NtrC family response regulator
MFRRDHHRILCVTRSGIHLKTFQSVLSSDNYEVVSAFTSDQAVAFCINNAVAAVVIDSEFLTVDGWSVAQTFKALHPGLPVILLVEDGHEGPIPQAVDAIAKTSADMLQELQRLLDSLPNSLAGLG